EEGAPRARGAGTGVGGWTGAGAPADAAGPVRVGQPGRPAGLRRSGRGADDGPARGPGVRRGEDPRVAGDHRPCGPRAGGSAGGAELLGLGGAVHAPGPGRADAARAGDLGAALRRAGRDGCAAVGVPTLFAELTYSTRSTAPSGSSLRSRATTRSTRSA